MVNTPTGFQLPGLKNKEFRRELLLVFISIFVGFVGGLGAIAFRLSIEYSHDGFFWLVSLVPMDPRLAVVLLPTLGGLLCGSIVYVFAKEAKGHGVPAIIESVNFNGGRMRYRIPFVKMITSAITIGSGGSAGNEGPIAQIGGGFGSMIGGFFDLNTEERKIMVIAGTSAGIAAIFNAPIAGILFGVEIIRRDKKMFTPFPLIMATVVGTTVTELYYGSKPIISFPLLDITLSQIILNFHFFIVLGVLMGLYAVFWVKGFYYLETLFEKIPASQILITTFGGLLVGIIELSFFNVGKSAYIGISEYGPIEDALNLKFTLQFFVLLVVAKFLATSFTLGSGGSGGVFQPTLLQGVMLGAIYAMLLKPFFHANIALSAFAILGMAGMFASSTKAPLTTLMLVSEMIGNFSLFIPLLFTVITSWVVTSLLLGEDFDIYKMIREGKIFEKSTDHLEELQIEDIMALNVIFVTPSQTIGHVVELMRETGHTGFPVIGEGKLFGIITEHDVGYALARTDEQALVQDVCTRDVTTVQTSCPVSLAAQQMITKGFNRMPVVEGKPQADKVIGWVTRSDILKAYYKSKSQRKLKNQERHHFEELINRHKIKEQSEDKVIKLKSQ